VTGSKYDVQFNNLDGTYEFGLAAFDNAQVRHAFHFCMQTRLRYSMRVIFAVLLIVAWTAVGAASITRAEGARELSKAEFNKSCAQCHGVTGKGDGPLGMYLTKAPADLTKLSQQSGGVFPFSRLYDVIDGRSEVSAHGPREMPVWGEAYTQEMQNRWPTDVLSEALIQTITRMRILMLIEYISTLQAK